MGICHSDLEESARPVHIQRQSSDNMGADKDLEVESPEKYDEEAVNLLKNELNESPEIFVLNNILMSVMFYENYRKKNAKLMHANSTKVEKELNPVLLKNETKNCIAPDAMFEEVNKNVYYQRKDIYNFTPEQLIPRRLFVINGDIEVFDSLDPNQYSEIDKPSYRVNMEESARKGYVKLRLIEKVSRPLKICESHTQGTSADCESSNDKDPKTEISNPEEIYEYATIKELQTPKRIAFNRKGERRDTLPENCFCKRKIKKNLRDIDLEDLENFDEENFYENVSYLRSKGFMEYFQNSIFPGSLGKVLGFPDQAIENATSIPGTIFCKLLEGNIPISCEIIPSVSISWPSIYAFDFETRKRPTVTDKRRGIRYKWPTKDMVEEIKKVNSVLIPTGFMKKKDMTVDNELEWEISFPKAERYIEVRMSQAQIKCFLFLVTLHKTFIEPETAKHGLLVDHIRKHMYWECESNYRDWPEHRLGVKILKVIENLNSCLSKAAMPDYFIKRKNVFENAPRRYLFQAHKVFHEVLQAPVMYFIKALRDLKYINTGKYYPETDFDELYKILTTDGAKYVNPSLIPDSTTTNPRKSKKFDDIEHCLKNIQYEKNKERRRELEERKKAESMNLNNKDRDSINLQWICEKKFDVFKTRSILVFFIQHFIEIAKASLRFKNIDQSRFYLKQAWYLTKILEEIDAYKPDALKYQDMIAREEDMTLRHSISFRSNESTPPSTPTRNFNTIFDDSFQQRSIKDNVSTSSKYVPNSTNKVKRYPSSLKTRMGINRSVSFIDDDKKTDSEVISKKMVVLDDQVEKEEYVTPC